MNLRQKNKLLKKALELKISKLHCEDKDTIILYYDAKKTEEDLAERIMELFSYIDKIGIIMLPDSIKCVEAKSVEIKKENEKQLLFSSMKGRKIYYDIESSKWKYYDDHTLVIFKNDEESEEDNED